MIPILPAIPSIIQQSPEWVKQFYSFFLHNKEMRMAFFAMHPYNENRFLNLAASIQEEQTPVGCFTGAGISKPYGFPTWREFLMDAAQKMGLEPEVRVLLESGQYPEAAQYMEDHDPEAFEQIIKRTFSHKNISPELKGMGALLPFIRFDYLVTTNFDFILEGIYELAGLRIKPIIYGANPSFAEIAKSEDLLPLLKIHGEYLYDRILTSKQYEKSYSEHSPLANHLVELFSKVSFLFVGFSLADEQIKFALQEAAKHPDAVPHFVLLPAKDAAEAEMRDADYVALGVYPLWYPLDIESQDPHLSANHILASLGLVAHINPDFTDTALAFIFDYEVERGIEASLNLLKKRPQCHVYKMAHAYLIAGSFIFDEEHMFDFEYINRAIKHIDRATGMVENFSLAYVVRSLLNIYRFSFNEAIEDLTQAIEMGSPFQGALVAQRGLYRFMFSKDGSGAYEDFKLSLEIHASGQPFEGADIIRLYVAFIEFKRGQVEAMDAMKNALESPEFESEDMRSTRDDVRTLLKYIGPVYHRKWVRDSIIALMENKSNVGPIVAWAGRAGILGYFYKRQFRRNKRRREKQLLKENKQKKLDSGGE